MKNDQNQQDAFVRAARELEADEKADALDRIMNKLDLTKKPESKADKPAKK